MVGIPLPRARKSSPLPEGLGCLFSDTSFNTRASLIRVCYPKFACLPLMQSRTPRCGSASKAFDACGIFAVAISSVRLCVDTNSGTVGTLIGLSGVNAPVAHRSRPVCERGTAENAQYGASPCIPTCAVSLYRSSKARAVKALREPFAYGTATCDAPDCHAG